MSHRTWAVAGALLCACLSLPGAADAVVGDPVVLANGIPTITLPRAAGAGSTPMNVGYHPIFKRYYGANGGSPSYSAFVYGPTGALIQTQTPINLDVRSFYYNPTTGNLECVTYAARSGSATGISSVGLAANGNLNGTSAPLLTPVPGFTDEQNVPAYDPARNRLYSRGGTFVVNVTDRASGNAITTVTLDTTGSNIGTVIGEGLGFDAAYDVFVTVDNSRRAYVHRLNGTRVGICQLPDTVAAATVYSLSYTNGQVFVFDTSENAWVGFRIFQNVNATTSTTSEVYSHVSWPVVATDTTVSGTIITQLGGADTTQWRLGHFMPSRNAYAMAGTFYAAAGRQIAGIHPEDGYWLITRGARTVNMLGLPVPNAYDVPLGTGPAGAAAWNQLGGHFNTPSPVAGLLVRQGGTVFSLTNPMQTFTERVVWTWNGSALVQQTGSIPANGAFWVKTASAGATNIVIQRQLTPGPAEIANAAERVADESPGLWDLTLIARQSDWESNRLTLGAADGVVAGEWNPLAIAIPPGPGGDYLRLVVKKENWGDRSDDYAAEYRPAAETMEWEFVLSGGRRPGSVELEFENRGLPAGAKLRITDVESGASWDVRPEETLTFAAKDQRRMRLAISQSAASLGAPVATAFRAYPNPFARESGLVFTLARRTDLRVDLFDVTGRRVRSFDRAGATPGEHVITWDGRDGDGHPLPSGIYLAAWKAGGVQGARRLVKVE